MSIVHATQYNEAKLYIWFFISEKFLLRYLLIHDDSRPDQEGLEEEEGERGMDLLVRDIQPL